MKVFILFIVLLVPVIQCQTGSLSELFLSIGLPVCIQRCTKDLMPVIDDLITHKIDLPRFSKLCSAYNTAKVCMESVSPTGDNCNFFLSTFNDVTSGLKYACIDQLDSFEKRLPCVNAFVNRMNHSCEELCHLNEAIGTTLHSLPIRQNRVTGSGALNMLHESGQICSALSCYLQCWREDANKRCVGSGTRIVEILLRPFDRLGEKFINDTKFNKQIKWAIPKQCREFFIRKKIDEMRFDSAMLANLSLLIAATRRQYISDDYEELNRIKEHLFLDVAISPPIKHAEWTPYNVSVVVLMLLVLLLNLIALIFTFVFCCVENNRKSRSTKPVKHHSHRKQMRVTFAVDEGSAVPATDVASHVINFKED